MQPIDLPGLTAAERAFQLVDGSYAVVRITRSRDTGADVPIKVCVRAVDATGATLVEDGVPLEAPARIVTVSAGGLADGAITIDDVMADATVDACDRIRRHVAARRAWAKIPRDPDEP